MMPHNLNILEQITLILSKHEFSFIYIIGYYTYNMSFNDGIRCFTSAIKKIIFFIENLKNIS